MCLHFSAKQTEDTPVFHRADPCCSKLHDSLNDVTKELVTHMEQSRDMLMNDKHGYKSETNGRWFV